MHQQNSKELLNYLHRNTKRPKYHRERTRKDRQKPIFANRIGETMEIKG